MPQDDAILAGEVWLQSLAALQIPLGKIGRFVDNSHKCPPKVTP